MPQVVALPRESARLPVPPFELGAIDSFWEVSFGLTREPPLVGRDAEGTLVRRGGSFWRK